MKNKKIFIFLSIVAVTILSSCNPDGPGIFYTISTEKKITTSALSEKAIYRVTSDGTSIFALAGASVYKQNSTSWDKLPPPADGMTAVSLAKLGTDIYAVYESEPSGSISDTVYRLSGSSWIEAPGTTSISGSLNITLVDVDNTAGSFIFISRRTGTSSFETFAYNGTTLSAAFDPGKALPLTGAAIHYDGSNNDYYLTASNNTDQNGNSALYFYDTSDGSSYSFSDVTSSASDVDFTTTLGGISETSDRSKLYLSTGNGFLYSSTDGTTWTKINGTALEDYYGNTAALTDLAVVNYNSTDYLIIGSDNGYFEMDLSGTNPSLPAYTAVNFETYDLSQEAVFSLYTDDDEIYLGSEKGLWLSVYINGAPELDQE